MTLRLIFLIGCVLCCGVAKSQTITITAVRSTTPIWTTGVSNSITIDGVSSITAVPATPTTPGTTVKLWILDTNNNVMYGAFPPPAGPGGPVIVPLTAGPGGAGSVFSGAIVRPGGWPDKGPYVAIVMADVPINQQVHNGPVIVDHRAGFTIGPGPPAGPALIGPGGGGGGVPPGN